MVPANVQISTQVGVNTPRSRQKIAVQRGGDDDKRSNHMPMLMKISQDEHQRRRRAKLTEPEELRHYDVAGNHRPIAQQ